MNKAFLSNTIDLADWVPLLFADMDVAQNSQAWLAATLHWLVQALKLEAIAWTESSKGQWRIIACDGQPFGALPLALMHEAIDAGKTKSDTRHHFVPMTLRGQTVGGLLARHANGSHPSSPHSNTEIATPDLWDSIARLFLAALDARRTIQSQRRAIVHRDQILEVAANWHSHHDVPKLLDQIARTATQLLRADRASIFLWDRPSKQLIGYPSLGIEGQPLRVPEDAGVVGTVLRSLQPKRWDRSDVADEVDRRVDHQSGYRTDSLVAVPLLDTRGRAMGVFEVLNQRDGSFEVEDEQTLLELARHAAAALANSQQIQQLLQVRDRLTRDAASQTPLMGSCPLVESLRATIARVAPTDLAVLLLGDNGTGKEVASRQIHYQSPRRHEPFIAVNCAAITESLLESELFGHEKGAFTDAHEARAGKFEAANGGTLFLDEIGDMSLAGQAKLLRVLEEKVVVRVGGSNPISVDVRIIAATNQSLVDLVRNKKFREDLYFRLTVVTLILPSLRERGSDILELADYFLDSFCRKTGRNKPTWTSAAKSRLLAHPWPGNIRELRNLVERIVYLSSGDVIDVQDLQFVSSPIDSQPSASAEAGTDLMHFPLAQATDEFQTKCIEHHIQSANGNMTLAAQTLGLQRTNLYRKMKQLGMPSPGP